MINDVFDKWIPKYMKQLAPYLLDTGFLVGDQLTIADFWIAGLYVNLWNNPIGNFAPERWAQAKVDYPAYAAYGERFA